MTLGWTAALLRAADAREQVRVDDALGDLGEILAHVPESWGRADLVRVHEEHAAHVRRTVEAESGLGKFIRSMHERMITYIDGPEGWEEPLLAADAATFFAGLLGDYEDHEVDHALRSVIDAAVEAAIATLMVAARPQVDALTAAVRNVAAALGRLGVAQRRIVLVELPVGNALPTRILEAVLAREGFATAMLSASLSRSDRGTARDRVRDLLAHGVESVGAMPDDVFVYIDEWVTGTNFNKVVGRLAMILARRTPRGYLLPAALLGPDAPGRAAFVRFARYHDDAANEIGLRGGDLRFKIPALTSRYPVNTPFFWGERDRLAGYRKMQLWGSMFSTLDTMIERLASDPTARESARLLALEQAAAAGATVEARLVHATREFDALFGNWLDDYRKIRPQLEDLWNGPAPSGKDVEVELARLVSQMHRIVSGRPAEQCIALATVAQARSNAIDPADRYYFEDHAPAVTRLTGGRARAHEILLRELTMRAAPG